MKLVQRLGNQPLAIHRREAGVVADLIRSGADETAFFGEVDEPDRDRPPYECQGGIAIIPVRGILLPGAGFGGYWFSFVTFYGQIQSALAHAIGSDEVRAIALHVDSGGGTVAGCFDLVDQIHALRGEKPIWAILDESAYSAAYAIASAADRVIVPRTGGTGSIGVVGMHVDYTGMLEQAGIKVTMLHYGARKVDSYPTVPLSDEARERAQADIDEMGELFVKTVARNRGLEPDAVRNTEAATFLGAHGVAAGLADEVLSPDQAFLALLETLDQAS